MPIENSHPCFQAPENPNALIWRYMDFTKFVALLDTQSLYFARSDRFDDPYEGATSHANFDLREIVYQETIPPEMLTLMSRLTEWTREWTYISCWHLNEHESWAMWKLYGSLEGAIAIQSTYSKLLECLKDKAYVGTVNYIDYETEWLPEGNLYWPFLHKRKSFEHEKEIRAIIQKVPVDETKKGIPVGKPNEKQGVAISLNLNDFIERIYVSPNSPQWFYELVKNVIKRFNYSFSVVQSSLSRAPVY